MSENSAELRRKTTGKQIGALTVSTPTKWSNKPSKPQKTPRDLKLEQQKLAEEEHLLKMEQERLLREQQEELQRIEAEKQRQRIEIRNLRLKKVAILLEGRAEEVRKGA